MMTRRQAIKTTTLASAAMATLPGTFAQGMPAKDKALISTAAAVTSTGPFTLPPLPYAYDALEPFIDAQTMQIHHDKHHAAYVANLNKAVADITDLGLLEITHLLKNLDNLPEKIRTAVRNNGGGHYNHSLFWQMMKKNGGGEPTGDLAKAIDASFGNLSAFKEQFGKAALGQFGSGWAWLVIGADNKLAIMATANQDTPIALGLGEPAGFKGAAGDMKKNFPANFHHTPLLGLDVWEHAYYLKYQNKRVDYIAAWWNVVNWDFVTARYEQFKS